VDRKQARAFEDFVRDSGDRLLRVAVLLTSDQHLAEDIYAEALERLAARWSRVTSPAAFCRQVMHNLVIDRIRMQQRRPRELGLYPVHDSSDPRAGDGMSAVELRPALLAALDTLTQHQRAIVVLRYFDDRSEAEVADLLGVSAGTVKSTASRAIARLRADPSLAGLLGCVGSSQ
jgi:RNA polymerase sigma-70 factor (sigma-E family)